MNVDAAIRKIDISYLVVLIKKNHIKFPKVLRKIVSPCYTVVAAPRQQS